MDTFTQWLKNLNEVKADSLGKINKAVKKFNTKATFKNVFGDKKRIVIPLIAEDKDVAAFLAGIKQANLPITFKDLKNGYVHLKVSTKQGKQNRKVRIAAYLQQQFAKTKQPLLQQLLEKWSIVKEKVAYAGTRGYSIIVSHYPLDIMRMSDHIDPDGYAIQSCHSPGNSYWHCAIKEAQVGGAVAYAVHTADLNNIDLQAEEIFTDRDRKIDGIVPVERLRLRRFTNGNIDILVPEARTYALKKWEDGSQKNKKISGFAEAVKAWAKQAQNSTLQQIDPQKDFSHFELRGGHYQDNRASTIWNNFFGTDVAGGKDSIDQPEDGDDEENKMTVAEWEAGAAQHFHQHRFRNCYVQFHGHEAPEGGAFGTWQAEVSWQFDAWDFVKKLPQPDSIERTAEFTHGMAYHGMAHGFDKSVDYSNLYSFLVGKQHYGFSNLSMTTRPGGVAITAQISDHNSTTQRQRNRNYGDGSLHQFEEFLDSLDRVEEKYDKIRSDIETWFRLEGFYKNNFRDAVQNVKLQHFKIFPVIYQQLYQQYDAPQKRHDYEIVSESMMIGNMEHIGRNDIKSLGVVNREGRANRFEFRTSEYAPLPFPGFVTYKNIELFSPISGLASSLFARFHDNDMKQLGYVECGLVFIVNFEHTAAQGKKILAGVRHIDNNWQSYVTKMVEWWQQMKLLHHP